MEDPVPTPEEQARRRLEFIRDMIENPPQPPPGLAGTGLSKGDLVEVNGETFEIRSYNTRSGALFLKRVKTYKVFPNGKRGKA